jgi:hypothetical protein
MSSRNLCVPGKRAFHIFPVPDSGCALDGMYALCAALRVEYAVPGEKDGREGSGSRDDNLQAEVKALVIVVSVCSAEISQEEQEKSVQ